MNNATSWSDALGKVEDSTGRRSHVAMGNLHVFLPLHNKKFRVSVFGGGGVAATQTTQNHWTNRVVGGGVGQFSKTSPEAIAVYGGGVSFLAVAKGPLGFRFRVGYNTLTGITPGVDIALVRGRK
jgi:hypothetical protein